MAEDLYGLPLDEFTKARNTLARELTRGGEKDEAARVKALRKPSQPAWIVNQLTRRRKREAKALLRAGDRLRSAQEKTLGGGGRAALEKAVAAERRAVEDLTEAAREVAAQGSVTASGANLARVADTLHAVSLDAEVRERFEAGDLTEDHAATGLEAMALMAPAPRKPRGAGGKPKKDAGAAARKRLRKAEAEELRVEEELDAARRELNAAQERVRQLEGRLTRAQKAVARAREGA